MIVIITGANRGLGKQCALELAKTGHTVIMACRNSSMAAVARNEIRRTSGNNAVHVMKLDLADTASIRRFVHNFRKRFADLDILINNAGIITQNYQRTKQGLESIGGTNYFGHYLLMRLLLPGFGKGSDKRIINLITCIYPLGRRYRFKKLQHYRWVRAYAVSNI